MITTICQTEGCLNQNIPLIWSEIGAEVFCGPCGQKITNIEVK